MSENTQLNQGAGGDTIRDLARQGGIVKTQVVQLDLGGASANVEKLITAGQQTADNSVPVIIASDQSPIPITGTFSLPTGAATSALQPAINGDGGALSHVTNFPTSQAVTGTFFQSVQPISATSLPLPTGAAQESGGNLDKISGAVSSGNFQVNLNQVNGSTTATGAGAVGSGVQRVAIGQDTSTIAGSAPGSPGSPSNNVVSVQGAVGMFPVAISGTVVAAFSGFTPNGNYFSATVSNGASTSTSLSGVTAGQTMVVYNPGSTPVNFEFGSSASAAAGEVIQPASWQAFSVPTSATHIATWGLGGTTSLQISVGTGLPTGAGGGSGGGGGGGGTVTQGPQGVGSSAWFVTPGTGAVWQLGASSAVIGSVAQSGGPWTVSWSGQTIAATQSGTWSVRLTGAAGGTLDSAAGTPNGQAVTIQGNAAGVAVPTSRVGYAAQNPNQIPVTASATPIVTARTGVPGTGRGLIKFRNMGDNDCGLGGVSVTFATGFPLLAGETSDWFPSTAAWSAICNTGLTTTVAFVELF